MNLPRIARKASDFLWISLRLAVGRTYYNGEDSAVSVVIQQIGLPTSFLVPDMWYHRLIFVNRFSADATLGPHGCEVVQLCREFGWWFPKETEPKLSPDLNRLPDK
jgi:hypothetical protein